jgi:hypothetical protein
MRREESKMLLKGTFKERNVGIVNVNNNELDVWFKELLKVKVFINAAGNLAIAKKKVMIVEDVKERFKRKAKAKGRVPVTRRNSKLNDGN